MSDDRAEGAWDSIRQRLMMDLHKELLGRPNPSD